MTIIMYTLHMIVWSLFVSQAQAADPMLPEAHRNTYAIAWRNDIPVLGAEITSTSYPANSYHDYIQKYGPGWKEQFTDTSELVIVYKVLFALQGNIEQEAQLSAPKWWSDVIRKSSAARVDNPIESLAGRSFAGKISFGPYTVLLEREYSKRLKRYLSFPVAARLFGNQYRFTGEWQFAGICDFVATFSPFCDPRAQKSRQVASNELSHLERFGITVTIPALGEKKAHVDVAWIGTNNATSKMSDKQNVASLYCRPIVSTTNGYGDTLEWIAANQNIATKTNSHIRSVCNLLHNSLSSKTVVEKQSCWHSYYTEKIANKIDGHMSKRHDSTVEAVRQPFRPTNHLPVSSGARLIATIDCGVGYLHFFRNPSDHNIVLRDVVGILEIQENGSPKLAYSFDTVEEGNVVQEIFLNDLFKGALLDYIRKQHPVVYQRIEKP